MPSFADLERLFSKFPVWRCPECGERKRENFMLFFEVPCEVPVEEIDHLERTFYAHWNDVLNDKDDMQRLRLWCATCEKIYPLPEGWKLVMR